jgi:predicted Fe-Mo cluster-binding NifX family protein
MRVGFPVARDAGLESVIFGHFASAPLFMIVDTETEEVLHFVNCDPLAPEAGCNALKAVCSRSLDTMVVDGIGDGFLRILNGCGIEVFQAESARVGENLALLREQQLLKVAMLNSAQAGRCNEGEETSHGCNHSHDEEE